MKMFNVTINLIESAYFNIEVDQIRILLQNSKHPDYEIISISVIK